MYLPKHFNWLKKSIEIQPMIQHCSDFFDTNNEITHSPSDSEAVNIYIRLAT